MDLKPLILALVFALVPMWAQAQNQPGPSNPTTAQHVICDSGCSGGTTDVDDGAVAGGQTTGLALNLSYIWNGANWARWTGAVTATLDAETTKVIGTVNLSAAQTLANVTTLGTITNALPSGTNLLGKVSIDQTTPGTTNRVDVGTFPDNEPFNIAQMNGATVTMGKGVDGTGVQRVSPSTDSAITSSSGALGALSAEVKVTIATGNAGCGVTILAGTLAATVTFQKSSDNSLWTNAISVNESTTVQAATAVFTNPNATTYFSLLYGDGALYVKAVVTSYTSGTATAVVSCTPTVSPFALNLSASVPGQAVPLIVTDIGGTDGTLTQRLNVLSTRPASNQNGAVTRPLMPTNGTQDMPSMDAAARTGFVAVNDGTDTALVTTDGVLQAAPAITNYISITGQDSVAAPTAATWYVRRQWALPSSAHFIPSHAWAAVTTALTKTLVAQVNDLGNLNVGTNVFTAGNSVASPFFYGRLFGCVTTVLSATPDTITPTYTDELGNSQAATGVVFAASTPVGNCFEFALNAAVVPSALDSGVRAVTAVTDSAATTGVVTFYGVNTLADFAGTAAGQTEIQQFTQMPEMKSSEQLMILMMQAATTAQLKTFGVGGSLR